MNEEIQQFAEAMEIGRIREQNRIMRRVNDLINSVVDYTLTPAQYDKAVERIAEVIKEEPK